MIKVEHIDVYGFDTAIRGMRNPFDSWNRSDSYFDIHEDSLTGPFILGQQDLHLMRKLFKGGPVHRKFARQIYVSMDITAPFYWWKEFDTYKVGTTANSCSTMHKLTSRPIAMSDFSIDADIPQDVYYTFRETVMNCEYLRSKFIETDDVRYWRALISLLPNGFLQKRTVTMNYETIFNMIEWRENHKLIEWREFVKILKSLPHVCEIIGVTE